VDRINLFFDRLLFGPQRQSGLSKNRKISSSCRKHRNVQVAALSLDYAFLAPPVAILDEVCPVCIEHNDFPMLVIYLFLRGKRDVNI